MTDTVLMLVAGFAAVVAVGVPLAAAVLIGELVLRRRRRRG